MRILHVIVYVLVFSFSLSAQNYKFDRLKSAASVLGLCVNADSLLPGKVINIAAKDGQLVHLRVNAMGEIEHIGIPLFHDYMRILQPSPVYDFLEYAVLNKRYKVNPNQLYLSKVIFKKGSWHILTEKKLFEYDCTIENMDDKLYIVTWTRDDIEEVVIGIPIEYELLNNDTRRNMERQFVTELTSERPVIKRTDKKVISEDALSIYGTEGLFVVKGKSYIVDLLNQNVYYKLTTLREYVDTIIRNIPTTLEIESVLPVVVNDVEQFPIETFANMMMCEDTSVPDVTMELNIHLSDYRCVAVTLPLSHLRAFCYQQGCNLYFACNGVRNEQIGGVMFASNLTKGYNHLFTIRTTKSDLQSNIPVVISDVYLYIPPIDKEKLFGIPPKKKSGANFRLP